MQRLLKGLTPREKTDLLTLLEQAIDSAEKEVRQTWDVERQDQIDLKGEEENERYQRINGSGKP